jgi:hypothetical protein
MLVMMRRAVLSILVATACTPRVMPRAASSFQPRGALFSRNPQELVLLLTDLDDPCAWSKQAHEPPPYSHLLVLFSDQRGAQLAEPHGPQDVAVLPAVDYVHARNELIRPRDRARATPPGVWAGVLVHTAGAKQNGPNSRGGSIHFEPLEPGARAAGHYELELEDGTHLRGDFDAPWCEPPEPARRQPLGCSPPDGAALVAGAATANHF